MHQTSHKSQSGKLIADDASRLGKRILILVAVLLVFITVISPAHRFGVGDDDPVEPVGDGRELGEHAPSLALVVYDDQYEHAAWMASTSMHAVEPRLRIVALRVPTMAAVDSVSAAAAEAIPIFLSRHPRKTVVVVILNSNESSLINFYRPFAAAIDGLYTKAHTLLHCPSSKADAKDEFGPALMIVRSTEQGIAFWQRIRRWIFGLKTPRRLQPSGMLGNAVRAARRRSLRSPEIDCLPDELFFDAVPPHLPAASRALPRAPAACVVRGVIPADRMLLPADYRDSRMSSFFTVVERECGTLPWDHASPGALHALRSAQHLSRSPFTTVDATPILKGNVIAVQLPHTTQMPLSRWATMSSLRAVEPSYRFFLVNPNSSAGRDPTPPATSIASLTETWQDLSPADATFGWVSGPAVAFAPFMDTFTLSLHSKAPVVLVGTCNNVQLAVALNDPPVAATRWLQDCDEHGGVDHIAAYVVGPIGNGSSADDSEGKKDAPNLQHEVALMEAEPSLDRLRSDDVKICILDDPRHVRDLAMRSLPDLVTASSSEDIATFIAAVATRCGSRAVTTRSLLGPWVDTSSMASVATSLVSMLARKQEADGLAETA